MDEKTTTLKLPLDRYTTLERLAKNRGLKPKQLVSLLVNDYINKYGRGSATKDSNAEMIKRHLNANKSSYDIES